MTTLVNKMLHFQTNSMQITAIIDPKNVNERRLTFYEQQILAYLNYRIYMAIRRGFPVSRMITNN